MDETHPSFIGVFGQFDKPHGELEAYVEAADCLLIVGAYKTDFTVTAFERSKTITIQAHSVSVGNDVFRHVRMADEQLPVALGCNDWVTARVTTCGELDAAIALAESSDKGAYIEIVTRRYSAHPITKGLRGIKPPNLKIQWAP